jgi:hypothetical protein
LGEDLAGELIHARGGGEAGRVGQCCVLGRAVRLGSHSPPRCVNATAFVETNAPNGRRPCSLSAFPCVSQLRYGLER